MNLHGITYYLFHSSQNCIFTLLKNISPMAPSPRHFSRFVFPFSFHYRENGKEGSFESFLGAVDACHILKKDRVSGAISRGTVWEAPPAKTVNNFFLPHIEAFLTENGKNNYLVRRQMTEEAFRKLFHFFGRRLACRVMDKAVSNDPDRKDNVKKDPKGKFDPETNKPFDFFINGAELYLFRSGLGFLCLETELATLSSPEDLVDLNYALHYFRDNAATIALVPPDTPFAEQFVRNIIDVSAEKDSFDTLIPAPFLDWKNCQADGREIRLTGSIRFDDIFSSLLRDLAGEQMTFNSLIGRNFLVYSFLMLPREHGEDREKLVYELKKVVNRKYSAGPDDTGSASESVMRTYENITFGISLEGSVILVEDNGIPFFQQFDDRVTTGYFHIYMIALHNRLALMHFGISLSLLIPDRGIRFSPEHTRTIQQVRNHLISFYLNAYFTQLTNNTVYERVYGFYQKNFNTQEILDDLKNKTLELDESIRNELEMQSNRLIRALTIIGAFAFPVSLLLAFFGANFTGENGARTFSVESFLISSGLLLATLFTAYTIFMNRWEKKRRH